MTKVVVDPGICGFSITIQATSEDMQHVRLKISTECPNIKEVIGEIEAHEFDAFKEVFVKLDKSDTYTILTPHIPHPMCLIYAGILKAIETETDLALPKDCHITIEKEAK
ncbi:MAG: hypothetical protein M1542_03880 [Thermotogae bacterium]|nr:hypothetical protein [Thermotogota bacterium]MCL5032379.1 hypothetical protein [Thermotogota bacterium]